MGIFKKFERQFGKPQGLLGRIAGKLMELKGTEKIEMIKFWKSVTDQGLQSSCFLN